MLIAYVDESGDLGPSHTYTLGCVLVDSESWPASFDALIAFRRFLRKEHGVPIRAELKANYILRNEGVKFTFKGPDLLQLQNVLAPRLAGIGVGRSTRTGTTISLYGVEHGREGEVLAEVQRAIDEVNQTRQAGRENAERERSAVEAAAVISETELEAVRESFRTAR